MSVIKFKDILNELEIQPNNMLVVPDKQYESIDDLVWYYDERGFDGMVGRVNWKQLQQEYPLLYTKLNKCYELQEKIMNFLNQYDTKYHIID